MTLEEFKKEHPRETCFAQIDDEVHVMTPEEYEAWCVDCVTYINDPNKL